MSDQDNIKTGGTAAESTATDNKDAGTGNAEETKETALGLQEEATEGDDAGKEADDDKGTEEKDKDKDKKKEEKKDKEEGDDDKDDKKTEDLFGKPENYDYKDVKLPEGMQLDEKMTGKFNEYATKLNLSQKGANDLMTMAVELTEQTKQQTLEAMGKLTEAKIESYKQLLRTDKEIGGAKLNDTLKTATLAYEAFADQETQELLAEAGLTVHPKVIKMFQAIGSQMQQDKVHVSKNPAGDKKNREDILYPSMEKND
jgi:hypothetical protein